MMAMCAATLCVLDSKIKLQTEGECKLINSTLHHIFSKRRAFHKTGFSKHGHHPLGTPEVQLHNVELFQSEGGFALLQKHWQAKLEAKKPSNLCLIHIILEVLLD